MAPDLCMQEVTASSRVRNRPLEGYRRIAPVLLIENVVGGAIREFAPNPSRFATRATGLSDIELKAQWHSRRRAAWAKAPK